MTAINFLGTSQTCHSSWCSFFNNLTIQNELLTIGNNFTPLASDIFKVFQTDLANCKVVIFGQDPYPQSGVATGRAFEVGNITHWNQLTANASLRNILKLLYKNHNSLPTVPSYSQIKSNLRFISPPQQLFVNWENQGVLLLNTALTCPQGNTQLSNAHATHWKNFTKETIKFIDSNTQNATWFLWGNKAKNFQGLISNGTKYCSGHPSSRNNSNGLGGFYHENHFSKVTSINWY